MNPIKTLAQLSTLTLSLMAMSLPSYAQELSEQVSQEKTSQQAELIQSIDINRASAEELASLDHIGEKKAQAIIEFRKLNGPFKTVDDLAQVKGIGQNTIEKNRTRMLVAQ